MNFKFKRLTLYLPFFLLSVTASVILRTLACTKDLGYSYGYFDEKALLTAANTVVTISALLLFSYLFFGSSKKLKASFSTPLTYVPTALVATALFFFAIALVKYAETGSVYPLFSKATLTEPRLLLALVGAVLAILSAIHFFLNSFIPDRVSEARAWFSLVSVVFLAIYASMLYFTTETPINSVNKLTDQMAFLFAAVFFLYETRISLGTDRWRGYIAFGLIAALLCAYSSIPALITYFAKGILISLSLEENLFTLALFLFISFRLILTATLPEATDAKEITVIDGFAKERAAQILAADSAAEDGSSDTEQISITDLLGEELPEDSEIYTPAVYIDEMPTEVEGDPQQITFDDLNNSEG